MADEAAATDPASDATIDVTPEPVEEPKPKEIVHPYRHNPLAGTGVVQLRYEYRCKICQLSSKAPTLYRKIHELVFNDHMSYNGAMNEVNTYIKQHGMSLTFLNIVNVTGHFKKHIQVEEVVAAAIRSMEAPPVPAAVQAIAPLAQRAVQDGLDDFRNLETLRHGITAQLEKLQTQLDVVDPKTNQLKLDKWSLDLYVKVVRETRAVINDLNEMRRSEKLMNNVVQTLLDRLTFAIIPQLLDEYKLIAEELENCKIPTEIVIRIDERLRRKTAEIIVQTTRAAVTEVQRQFKLR
jgi:hypothetical protein